MHSLYSFDFIATVTAQLMDRLRTTSASQLNTAALLNMTNYQIKAGHSQGVYVVHYAGRPVYVGKAQNISIRLTDHLFKLSGRRNIDTRQIYFQAIYLDQSMSTAANENLLISQYKMLNAEMWNGAGFGTKDPGRERDTTRPNGFDQAFPINELYYINLELAPDYSILLSNLLENMKAQLPYVFRYGSLGFEGNRRIILPNHQMPARSVLQSIVTILGGSWQGVILSYGMVLYNERKTYAHATVLLP